MKVITKRLSIKILSILLLGVLSLGGLFLHNNVKATAAGTDEIATTDLLTTNANVELKNGGMSISSNDQYEGELKGVFKGDATFKFNFPETYTDTDGDGKLDKYYGDFKFRVTDAMNADNYFEINYYVVNKANNYTALYVQYGSEVRMNNYNGNGWYNSKRINNTTFIFAPSFLSNCGFVDSTNGGANYSDRTGILSLVWTGDVLAVQANTAAKADETLMRTIAAFDGTYDKNVDKNGFVSGQSWGLPKLNLSNGYKISFSSNFSEAGVEDHGTDVTLKEITTGGATYDLTQAKQTNVSFYTNYLTWLKNNPTEKVNATDLLKTTGKVTRDEKGLRISSDNEYTGTFEGVFIGDAKLRFTFPETFKDAYYGDFTFRITDAMDESNYFDIKYYVVHSADHYTAVYVQYQKEIRMTFHNGASWYNEIQMNKTNYHTAPAFLSTSGVDGKFDGNRMGILSLSWTDGVLSVETNSARNTDVEKMLTVAKFDGTYDTDKADNGFVGNGSGFGLPKMNFENGYKISFSSSIESSATTDKGTDVCFKEVAGVNLSNEIINSSYKYNMTFENAKVSGTDVYIPQNDEIGDIKLVYAKAYGTGGWQTRELVDVKQTVDTSTIGSKPFTITDDTWKETLLGEISQTYTVYVEKANTLTFNTDGGTPIEKIVHSEHTTDRITVSDAERLFWVFDGWYIGTEKWSGNLSDLYGKDITLEAHWLDVEAPTIWLNGIKDKTYALKGATVNVGKADVVAGDDAQNDTILVTIALKKPGETEFKAITDAYALKLEESGSYAIQYTVTDAAGFTATCERTVEVFERNAPVLTVGEGFSTQSNPGLKVDLATVTAKNQDGETLAVAVSVVKDGVLIAQDVTSFVPTSIGEYTVTYFTTDKAPYESLQSIYSYTVVVGRDDVAPVIGDEFVDVTVQPHTTITIPNVTATDNVSGNVSVEISVYYGTQKITLKNNSFVADQVGTYRVLLTAEDEAGNKTEKTVYVTVAMEGNQGGGNGGCGGCGGASANGGDGLPMGLLIMLSAFVFGKNIMMKKSKRKENI